MDADLIARFTAYNLPGGMVPVVDGIPRWPWDEVVARRRLGQVAKLAGLRLTGDEVFVGSGSNDTWFLSGDTVLQVCYRGDVAPVREAELLAVSPGGVPGPAVLDYGRDRLMSWIVVKRVHAGSLWHAWAANPVPCCVPMCRSWRRSCGASLVAATRAGAGPVRCGRVPASGDRPARHRGEHPDAPVCEPARPPHRARPGRAFTDQDVLDTITARLAGVAARITISRDADVVLHGDCTPANVLVRDGRVVALLDFEWSGAVRETSR